MKKKVLAMVMAAAMAFSMAACGSGEKDKAADAKGESTEGKDEADKGEAKDGSLKIGLSVQTLGNQVWAQQMDAIQKAAEEDGHEATVVECNENANTQINQIENFITSGSDIIIVNPETRMLLKKGAEKRGMQEIRWYPGMRRWRIPISTGSSKIMIWERVIGEQAAEFINENFEDGKCEVAVLGYPQTSDLLERENGILDSWKNWRPMRKLWQMSRRSILRKDWMLWRPFCRLIRM